MNGDSNSYTESERASETADPPERPTIPVLGGALALADPRQIKRRKPWTQDPLHTMSTRLPPCG